MKTCDIDRHAVELKRDGYTIAHDVMSEAELETSKQAIEETLSAEEEIGYKYGLQNEDLRMAFNGQAKHPHFYGILVRHPQPAEVVRRVLGNDMFCHDMAIRVPMPTGTKDKTRLGGNLHADWSDFTVAPFIGGKHFTMGIQSVWAITEFTAETGGPMVWPGSHLALEIPPEEPETLPAGGIVVEAPAGSVVMWDSALWHTGGINRSDRPRHSLVFYFQRWWVKGFNDAYRFTSPEVRTMMTEKERRSWGLEAAVPPNTHFRGMTTEQIEALTPEEKAVLNIASY